MASTLHILAVVTVGMFLVDSQLFPLVVDDKPGVKESEGVLSIPRTTEIDDRSKKGGRLFPDNDTEVKKPESDRYIWSRDLGEGENASERALASNESNVIVVMSRDKSLFSRNLTRSTSVYNFADTGSLVAIIPWGYYGPCLIRNTTLTYPGAIDMLTVRNGSSFQATNRLSIDANVAPLSTEEATTFLAANPFLQRWCSFRPIIITVDLGDNPKPYSNTTEEIVTLLLEADVNIIIPERPDSLELPKIGGGKPEPQPSIFQGARWGYARDLLLDQGGILPKTGA